MCVRLSGHDLYFSYFIVPILFQVASALQYLHDNKIIYRDLKSDNVLVWKFPDPQDAMFPVRGADEVLVKLSDYGISQFVATQGARGLVGTPGFMAPEMLKYQGKEVYRTLPLTRAPVLIATINPD